MKRVLCVCFGNTCRSPMMEVMLRDLLLQSGSDSAVESAGISPDCAGRPASLYSVKAMERRGLDLHNHRSQFVGDLDLSQYDLVLSVGETEAVELRRSGRLRSDCQVVVLNQKGGGIPNPYQQPYADYEQCADVIERSLVHVKHLAI